MDERLDYPLVSKLLARTLGTSPLDLEGSFRPATAADLGDLLRLRETHTKTGHRPNDRAYLEWCYDLTGADPGRSIWVLRHRGEAIGTLGVDRDVFSHGGTDVPVHQLVDLLAREDHMGSGVGVWMHLRLQQMFENTFSLGSTPHSHSIMTRLYSRLPDWQTWRYAVRLRRRHAALAPLDALLGLRRTVLRRLVHRNARLVTCNGPIEDSTLLREHMSERQIMPSRTAEWARWRLAEHPHRQYSCLKLVYGDRLAACAVISTSGRRAEISDALVRNGRDEKATIRALFDLLTLVTSDLASRGIEVVGTRVNDPTTAAALRRVGFIHRPESCVIGYRFRNPTLAAWIAKGVPLFLMPVDSDFD